jgi:hypothetical protein
LFTSDSVRRSTEDRDHRSRLQPNTGFNFVAKHGQNIVDKLTVLD